MIALPEAPPSIRAEILDWLDRFAACVREVDYAAARPSGCAKTPAGQPTVRSWTVTRTAASPPRREGLPPE